MLVLQLRGSRGVPVIHRDLKPSNIIVSGVRYAADAGMTFFVVGDY